MTEDQATSSESSAPAKPARQGAARKGKPRTRVTRTSASAKRKAAHAKSEPTAARAAKLAGNLIEFERATFGNATAILTSLNDHSEKALRHVLSKATWMPKEGQKILEEWQRTLRHSLKDFAKVTDKSFELMSKYVARLDAESSRKERKP